LPRTLSLNSDDAPPRPLTFQIQMVGTPEVHHKSHCTVTRRLERLPRMITLTGSADSASSEQVRGGLVDPQPHLQGLQLGRAEEERRNA